MMLKAMHHYLIGMETEYFILDSDGYIANAANCLLQEMRNRAKKECSANMIEVISMPTETITGAALDVLGKARQLLEAAERNGLKIFPYGTYPGLFNPEMRKEKGYGVKERIFGREAWKIAGRCVGFHCHYTLTKGLFDSFAKNIKLLTKGERNRSLVDSYNMLVAADPAFGTFLQSSPFYQGRLCGKDARMLFYRGNLGVKGLYSRFQEFGALPSYKYIVTDIMYEADERFARWKSLMKKRGITANPRQLYDSPYDVNWSPVKVNPIGTFEMRGMDMNRFELLISAGVLMRYVLKSINSDGMKVAVEGAAETFRIEDEKATIPTFSHAMAVQKAAARGGMKEKIVRDYCRGFLKFVSPLLPKDKKKCLRAFRTMVSKRSTVSDEIIAHARKTGAGKAIGSAEAAELSLKLAENVPRHVRRAEKIVSSLQ